MTDQVTLFLDGHGIDSSKVLKTSNLTSKLNLNFIPDFLPKLAINYIFGLLEFLLGLGVFFDTTIKNAAIGIFILLLIFLPIHIWDATKVRPAIGSKKIAFIRIPLQFVLMYCTYIIYINS